jgi:outer membrane biogenesis lipoprotein LolB
VRRMTVFLLLVAFLVLPACGGGGNGGPDRSSDWDRIVWDQDNWA